MADPSPHPSFPTLLQRFFVDHLRQQRAVSANTIASYRDTFRLLLAFAQKTTRKSPTDLAESRGAPMCSPTLRMVTPK